MKKYAILFDLDGTLLDTLGGLAHGVNHVLQAHGLRTWSLEDIRSFVGNGARNLILRACEGKGDADLLLQEFKRYYDANCSVDTAPYPHIPEVLEILARRYPLAVVSNKPDSATKRLCDAFFPGITAFGETPDCPRKPAPDRILSTVKQLGADTCIYIGDSEVDVLTAKNAGVPCISVLWGFRSREEIEAEGGICFCQDPRQLPDMIESIIGDNYGK